jgi:tetratricopeptide (TPR) repeat protein
LKLREKEGDKINIISSRNDLAYACLSDGETVKVKELAEITLGMAIETENKEELTRAYLTLGNCLVKMQKTKEARENFSQALKISKQINNKSLIGKTYYSIGELYIAEKEYLAAERPLKDSVMIFEELEENYELALSLISLYRLYEETGTESPTEYLTKGKEILHNLGVEIKNIKA